MGTTTKLKRAFDNATTMITLVSRDDNHPSTPIQFATIGNTKVASPLMTPTTKAFNHFGFSRARE
jgi:hypothetical protein